MLWVVTLIVFGYLQLGVSSNTQSLPIEDEGYKYTPGIGRHKVHNVSKNWDEARKICQAEGGDLAIVNCRQESRVIAELVKSSLPHSGSFDSNYALIGFDDRSTPTDYITLEYQPLTMAGFNEWDSFEPSETKGEDCGSISHSGRLNDISCMKTYAFVCERPELENGLPVTVVNVTAEEKVIIEGNKISITCNVDGYPSPTVLWYKNGNLIRKNSRINMSNARNLIISMANINDAGEYRCEAANAFTKDTSTVDVVVIVPVRVDIVVDKSPFHEGTEVIVNCNVDGYPTPEVLWYKDENPIQITKRINISSINSLTISNAEKNDAGMYRCDAANEYTNDTYTVNITIDVPVKVGVSADRSRFVEEGEFSIVCNVDGYPSPKVQWYKDDHPIQTNRRIKIVANTLIVTAADKNDAGIYRCEAANEYTRSLDTVDIKMAVKPKVRLSVDRNPFLKGTEFTIICVVHNYPTLNLTWYKDDNSIQTNNRITIFGNKLIISHAEESDAGNYSCEASNQYTTNADTVEIKATVPVGVKIAVDKGPFNEGSQFTMTCNAVGFPTPILQWYKDNNLIQSNNRINITANELIVSDAKKNDAGTYECKAANEYTSSAHTVDIVVTVPVTVHVTANSKLFPAGSEISIVCHVIGYPTPEVLWWKDDNSIQADQRVEISANILIITAANKNDVGRYRCDAANGYSSSSDTVDIKMDVPVQDEVKISVGKTSFLKDSEISITCNVDDHLIPTIKWYKDGNPVGTNYKIKISRNKLIIDPADTNDSGKYRCATSHGPTGSGDTVDITVTAPVEVNVAVDGGPFNEGSQFTMTCYVAGYPTPALQWLKDDNPIIGNYRITIVSNKLIVSAVTISDAGRYSCRAANDYTSGAHTVNIEVIVPMRVHVEAEERTFISGDKLSLFCNVDGYPTPQVLWYKDDDPVQRNQRIRISSSNTLIISQAISSDSGTYRCQAMNQYTSGAHTINVLVRERLNLNLIQNSGKPSKATCQNLEDWITLCTDAPISVQS